MATIRRQSIGTPSVACSVRDPILADPRQTQKPRESAEASGLWTCRPRRRTTNPPNLPNLQSNLLGGGLTLPLPPPRRSVPSQHPRGRSGPAKCVQKQILFNISAFWPHQTRSYAHHTAKVTPNAPIYYQKVDFLLKGLLF